MCRIFGFRSVLFSQVHKSLVSADNALISQGELHPDGWGVAYYINRTPHVIKSMKSALQDKLFKQISGIVSSQTVVAHIRKATQGEVSLLNAHPFQYGQWVFAHNGNIKNYEKLKPIFEKSINPDIKRFTLGETDSETIFHFLLTKISEKIPLESSLTDGEVIKDILTNAIKEIINIIGPLSSYEKALPSENFLTFVITNGEIMYAFQGGQSLYYSTYKTRCSERETCPRFLPICENAVSKGKVNHLIFSSEPLSGENIWKEMKQGQLFGVDSQMNFSTTKIDKIFL